MSRAYCIHAADNVATLLDDSLAGPIRVFGENAGQITSVDPIELGHKVALRDIPAGEAVVKFGISIGTASQPIRAGQWVHLHNCTSTFDVRSQTFDVHTGATTDTRYE